MKKRSYAQLVAILRALGARDPEGWARSEIEEGIPQLERFLFLRGAWKNVVGDTEWIAPAIAAAKDRPDSPGSGVGLALERLLASGADPADLTEIVRGMQYEVLFGLCYLMGDPAAAFDDLADRPPELDAIEWGLWAARDGRPLYPVDGLHEDALGMDPTGEEMRHGAWRRRVD